MALSVLATHVLICKHDYSEDSTFWNYCAYRTHLYARDSIHVADT
jgi:hypothetical protein